MATIFWLSVHRVHIGATWRIRLNRPCVAVMWPYYGRPMEYIFMLWFVLSSFFFFFPRLISAAADWMSAILPHMVWP